MSPAHRLDETLARIRAGSDDFILCDARDPDMARGIAAFGVTRLAEGTRRPATRQEFLATVRAVVAQGVIDLVLLSPQNLHRLAVEEAAFHGSAVARAVRANDTTDIWLGRHAIYRQSASQPFRNADLARVLARGADGAIRGADLGLYSVTFVNDLIGPRLWQPARRPAASSPAPPS
jgi:hypothetical protein